MPTILYPIPFSAPDTCNRGNGAATFQMSGGIPPYTYQWSPLGSTANSITGVAQGNYSVTITDVNGCDTVLVVPVTNIAGPTALITANPPTAGVNEPVVFADASNPNGDVITAWAWTIGDSTYTTQYPPVNSFPEPGTYTVTLTVTNSMGCTDTYTMTIDISDEVVVPNVFSPNNDGTNDLFEIKFLSLYPNSTLVIYNRWGAKVFESTNYQNNWMPSAGDAHDGTYYYVLDLSDGHAKQGFVTITR
jgi:gliding motility-associated-like protein